MPVKSIARSLTCRHTFNIARSALVAIGSDAPDMPHALLLLTFVLTELLVNRQLVSDAVTVDVHM